MGRSASSSPGRRGHPGGPSLDGQVRPQEIVETLAARTAFGFPFGAIPAGGAEIPTFLSYITEKRLTKHPEEFGKGAIEGVAGPEAANNASAAGTMVPMLSLGLPTNATAAVMLAALVSYGIQPGPLLLQREGDLVWG